MYWYKKQMPLDHQVRRRNHLLRAAGRPPHTMQKLMTLSLDARADFNNYMKTVVSASYLVVQRITSVLAIAHVQGYLDQPTNRLDVEKWLSSQGELGQKAERICEHGDYAALLDLWSGAPAMEAPKMPEQTNKELPEVQESPRSTDRTIESDSQLCCCSLKEADGCLHSLSRTF
ncbi:hypothetical protein EIP91_009857 [Steccherinum ochraceum]|uniref:Uncharacterized protein n=1 Tax=Steccherinum ochraceum TaxID=92696 RepID=A0A4R0RDM5_9APHY|nr:hypothetical protein EIP91_009857 [Steccherinum ochraceum]